MSGRSPFPCPGSFVGLLVVLAAAVAPPGGSALGAEPAAPVEAVSAVPSDTAETLRLTGTVTAERRAGLSPRISGLVAAVHVDAGDRVDAGDVLVELDPVLARLSLDRARASLDEARARLAEAKRLEHEASQLVEERHIPETEAHARAAAVKMNAAAVARLDAEAREAAEILERHAVVAPFAGVISQKLTEVGEWVETGTPILTLVGTEGMRLDVQAPQERFVAIDESTPVTVRLDGHPEEAFPGHVIAKVPVNDPADRTFLVRVRVEGAAEMMIPGMSAQAAFAIRGAGHALAVPRDALVRGADGTNRVWVVERVDGDLLAFPREVHVGRSLAESVEILGGLEPELPVVVRGNESLRDGQRVRVVGGD